MAHVRHGKGLLPVWIWLITMLWSLSFAAWGAGGAFGERDFVRRTTAPVVETVDFGGYPGSDYILTVYNGGRSGQFDPVTSALITVNGNDLFVPDDFKQQVPMLQRRLTFADSNRLTVELRSKPDSGLTIVIEPVQKPPRISSSPLLQGLEDVLYQYGVLATDPNGDVLRYSLVSAPAGMQVDPASGVIRWMPGNDQVGSHAVLVRVEDPVGLADEQAYTLTILNVNDAPVITSTPLLLATEDQPYLYAVTASDVDSGDTLSYRLVAAPEGMVMDAVSGRITWIPFNADVGEHDVQVVLTDAAGATAVQAFRLQVVNTNDAPVLLTTSLPAATEHVSYSVPLAAIDEDLGDQLTIRLDNAPTGMTVDAVTGVISWLPGSAFGGQRIEFTVVVTDLAGLQDSRVLVLEVINTNDAPVIVSQPLLSTPQFDLYQYQVLASDPDAGDTPSFALTSGPAGMTLSVTGLLTWQPQSQEQVADHPVTLTVVDGGGLTTAQSFVLKVTDVNDAPAITSLPVQEATATLPYRYLVTATDVDSELLTFTLLEAPAGMTLSASGELVWLPGVTAVGPHTVRLQVTDAEGARAEQSFLVTVGQPPRLPLPPVITSLPAGNVVAGEWFRYQAVASDPNPGDVLAFAGLGGAQGYQVSPTGLLEWLGDARFADAMADNDVSCRVTSLPTGVVEPVLRWHWTGSANYSTYNQVMASPVVAPLKDTNGDGVVNLQDAPAILFASFRSTFYTSAGVLRVVDGATGTELWSRPGIVPGSTPAVGDLNRDGRPDIVIYELTSVGAQVTALDADGNKLWTTAEVIQSGGMGAPTLADLEGDGEVEILVGPRVFRANGTLKWRDASGYATAYNAIAADLDLDGQQEVIVGGSAYRANGTRLFKNDTAGGGHTAVGNFNADEYPEIVVVAGGKVSLLNRLGAIQWTRALPGSATLGGAPTIADVDNDGQPEIGVASRIYYSVLNTNGTIRWNRSVQDSSSQSTGSTAMDLDGDGLMEIAYADELNLRIYNADTGHVLYQIPNPSGTLREYPVFADVDGDSHGDLVVVGNTLYTSGPRGVRVFSGKNNGWVKTRALWNQFAYHIDNINDDLTVPARPARSWLSHNTYRLNSSPVFTSLADLQVDGLVLDQGRVRATVRNRGAQAITTPVAVSLALGDESAMSEVARTVLPSLPARSVQMVEFVPQAVPTTGVLQVEAQAAGVEECRTGNNRARAPLFTVQVTDSDGLSDQQTFALSVREAPAAPVFVSTPITSVRAGFLYRYLAEAIDANAADGRTYRLTTRPLGMSISPYTGLISWLPTPAQAGAHPVVLTVTDASGLVATQSFTLSVLANQAPVITSTAPATAVTAHVYNYQVIATDPEGDAFTYSLTAAQPGMAINGQTGLVSWTPATTGSLKFTVSVLDALGAASTQTVTVQVAANTAPAFTSTPVTVAFVGRAYRYRAQAIDAEGDGITYSLTTPPSGMTIVAATGEVAWTPTLAQKGQYTIKVNARDSAGATSTQTFTLTARTNAAPVITSQPTYTFASLGAGWSYQLTATDADGDALVFSLVSGPAGLTVTTAGLVSWIPAPDQQGPQTLVLRVSDGQLTHEQTLTIAGITGTPPQISSVPPVTAKAGRAWGYQVLAQDPDGHVLAYSLRSAPAGMIVSGTGLLSWLPGSIQVGSHAVVLRVADNESYMEQAFTVTVLAADATLALTVTASPSPVDVGQNVVITLTASGAAGQPSYQLTVDGQPLPVAADGRASYTPTTPGIRALVGTVSDGYDTAQASGTLRVRDPNDTTPPVAVITAPVDDDELRLPMVVTGTVEDPGLEEYKLYLQPVGSQDYVLLARGTTPVSNGPLGRFDPTQLENGLYRLILVARDLNGQETVFNATVEVYGEAKVGNFSVAFRDVNIDAMGIPIVVTRSYDTRRKFENLDFGYGWSVDYRAGRVQKNMTTGLNWAVKREGPLLMTFCLRPVGKRTVMVSMPDGKLHRFDVRISPECETGQVPQGVSPVFIPRPGTTSTLVAEDVGALLVQGNNLYDPSTGLPYSPTRFTLTTQEGFKYVVQEGVGILSVTDPKGNKLTYTANGVQHSNGQGVQFLRNADGRIREVVDPMGNRLQYAYDASGNLISVQDARGEVSTMTYNPQHALLSFTDPRNVLVLRNEYDADGRLVAQYDAQGTARTLAHDLDQNVEVLTDRLGRTTRYEFDAMGNITRQVDAAGGVTTTTYDAYGNELTVTDPLSRTTASTYWRDSDKVLSRQDALGHVTAFTYDGNGNQTSTRDARGHTSVNTFEGYDLKVMTDAEGGRTELYYDAQGNLITLRDAGGLLTSYGYDVRGNRTSESNGAGQSFTYTYDANNRELTRSEKRTTAAGVVTLTWRREYDANGNLVQVTDPLGGVETTEYDSIGKVAARTDRRGQRTEYTYDGNGRLVLTRYADGSTETVGYDAEGNKVSETERAGRETRYEYDALNRLVKTVLPNGDSLSSTFDAAGQLATSTDARGRTTTYAYDAAGRQTAVTDTQGRTTTYTHDANGNVLTMTDPRGKVTRYTYDQVNRRTTTTLPNGRVLAVSFDALGRKTGETLPSGRTVQYGYDRLGRLTSVTDHRNQVTRYTYDEAGNKLTQTDAKGRITRWTYDALSRVTSRTLPDGTTETYHYEAAAGGQ